MMGCLRRTFRRHETECQNILLLFILWAMFSFSVVFVRFAFSSTQNGPLHFCQLIRLSGFFKYALISFIAIIIVVLGVAMVRKANANTKVSRRNFYGMSLTEGERGRGA